MLTVLSVLMMSGGFVPAIVAADEGGEHSSEDSQKTEGVRKKVEETRKKADDRAAELKSRADEKAKDARRQVCQGRKTNITNRLENITNYGERHKKTFDNVLARVDDFVARKNLSTTELTDLRAAIETAESRVEAEIEALNELKGSVDCNDPDSVAAVLETYRDQTVSLRDVLKAYRESIRVYMQAVKQAAEAAEPSGEDTTNTEETES